MLKIFATQISGILNRIQDEEDLHIEEGARLLAQACIGEGHIYIAGFHEVEGLSTQLLTGETAMPHTYIWKGIEQLTPADRVLILTPLSNDSEAVILAQQLKEQSVMTIGISAIVQSEQSLEKIVDVHLDTKVTRALVPTEDGTRVGKPAIIATSFLLHGLQFIIQEILEEY